VAARVDGHAELRRASLKRELIAHGADPADIDFEMRLAEACDLILASPTAALPKPGPNAAQVGPDARWKLRGILRHYAKKPHPFAACVRDNRKRFGPRAEAVCAVVKDLIRGTTHWRGHNNPKDVGAAGLATIPPTNPNPAKHLSEQGVESEIEIDDEVARFLEALAENPELQERVIELLDSEEGE